MARSERTADATSNGLRLAVGRGVTVLEDAVVGVSMKRVGVAAAEQEVMKKAHINNSGRCSLINENSFPGKKP